MYLVVYEIKYESPNNSHDEEKLSQFLDYLLENGTIVDGTMATSPSHQQQMWPLRERISEALLRDGYCYKYDISLPFKSFYRVNYCKLYILENSTKYLCKEDWTLEWTLLGDFSKLETRRNIKKW